MFLHLDMDAFFAAIEQKVNPALRGKPVIVGARRHFSNNAEVSSSGGFKRDTQYRSVVCAASYEAKAFGIDSGMPSWQAFKLCPRAIFVPADSAKYIYTSRRIFALLQNFSPQVEAASVDEFYLNITGCERLFHSRENMARQIKARIKEEFGLTCSIGIAPTLLSAKLAAKLRKPDGLLILDRGRTAQVLKNLPVGKICGIGPRLQKRFHSLGIFTCGQLAEYPFYLLEYHFGKVGPWLQAAAKGEDAGDIQQTCLPHAPPKSVGHSQTLREVTSDQEYIESWLYLLSEMAAQRLRAKELQGRTVHVYFSDGFEDGFSRQKIFGDGTCDGYEIYRRALFILREPRLLVWRVRVLGVSVSCLEPLNHSFLFEQQIKRDRLLTSVDQINHRWGEWSIYPASLKNAG